jgi:hypothetical protein
MPEGSRLFTADVQTIEWKPFPTPTAHFPCIAIIERRAFVPTLFAHPTQQPVQFVGVYGQLAKLTKNSVVKVGDRLSWIEILSNYDYVLMIHEKGEMPVPEKGLVPAADNEHFTLYRVAERSAADETFRKTTK